jgi:triphosphatase
LTLFDSVLPMMQAGWLKAESQWVGHALGSARNWDAFLEDILAPLEASRPDDKSLAALREQCLRARDRNYDTARDAIRSPRYTAFVLNFSLWLDEAPWRTTRKTNRREILGAPLKAYAGPLLERHHRKLVKQGRRLASKTPEKRHKLRLAVKKMRYASEFFASLYSPQKSRAMIGDLACLQTTLGDLNDLAVTERQLETVIYQSFADPAHDDIVRAVGVVVGWCTARAKRGDSNLRDQWERFIQRKRFWKRIRKK